jgi:hypothetical protein
MKTPIGYRTLLENGEGGIHFEPIFRLKEIGEKLRKKTLLFCAYEGMNLFSSYCQQS